MNNVSTFISSLLPSFESSKVKDNLTNLNTEIGEHTIPAMASLLLAFPPKWKWKNKDVAYLNNYIADNYKGRISVRDANSLDIANQCLVNMQTTLPFAIKQVVDMFGGNIAATGLTFDKATVLRYAEVAEFVINYTRKLSNFISATELAELTGSRVTVSNVSPGDLEFLKSGVHTFVVGLDIMALTVADLKSGYATIPKAIVDESSENDMSVVVGRDKMDPFGFASLPFPLSVFLHVRLAIADWQMDRYEQAVADAKVIQYRSLLIKQMIENGTGDANVEGLLEDEEAELKVVKRKIAQMEDKYGLTRTQP